MIIASGAKLKRLGVPGEMEFEYKGVSQCADCDGPMYRDEDVVVVGGGDSALQEALVLAHFCKRVHLVHRGAKFRARQALIDEVAAQPVIQPLWNTVVEAIEGDQMVKKVRVRNTTDGKTTELAATGFFAYVGLEPNVDFVPAEIKRDERGRLLTDASLQTRDRRRVRGGRGARRLRRHPDRRAERRREGRRGGGEIIGKVAGAALGS